MFGIGGTGGGGRRGNASSTARSREDLILGATRERNARTLHAARERASLAIQMTARRWRRAASMNAALLAAVSQLDDLARLQGVLARIGKPVPVPPPAALISWLRAAAFAITPASWLLRAGRADASSPAVLSLRLLTGLLGQLQGAATLAAALTDVGGSVLVVRTLLAALAAWATVRHDATAPWTAATTLPPASLDALESGLVGTFTAVVASPSPHARTVARIVLAHPTTHALLANAAIGSVAATGAAASSPSAPTASGGAGTGAWAT